MLSNFGVFLGEEFVEGDRGIFKYNSLFFGMDKIVISFVFAFLLVWVFAGSELVMGGAVSEDLESVGGLDFNAPVFCQLSAIKKMFPNVCSSGTSGITGFAVTGAVVADVGKRSLLDRIERKGVSVDVGGGSLIDVAISEDLSMSQLQAVLLWEKAEGGEAIAAGAVKEELDLALRNVALMQKAEVERENSVSGLVRTLGSGVTSSDVVTIIYGTKIFPGSGRTVGYFDKLGSSGLESDQRVQIATYAGRTYVCVLGEKDKNGRSGVFEVYSYKDGEWVKSEKPDYFERIVFSDVSSSKSCSNVWPKGKAEINYYESGKNKGLPAIVPFDLKNGWYVMVSNSGGGFSDDSPKAYEASGNVRHMKICNIGANRLMENCKGDDPSKTFAVNTIGSTGKYGECPSVDVKKLYTCATNAIRDAASQNDDKNVRIRACMNDDVDLKKGRPMSQIGGFECQDFMSPIDCKLMFNVCDPVICPPSRCDLGGKFPVSDVIQTGIIGSLALCLPNAKEGIFIPICLSGVHAGLDAYVSILKSERACLEHSLEDGELVGICDQITSVYKCEFFWGQVSPLMDYLIPNLIGAAVDGDRVRGGGEYAFIEQSWNSMKKSISYFKNTYAQNAFRAFNIRSTQEIGSSFCKAFIGTSVPGSASFLENLLAPESPSQFYAQFSEKLFTEATVPSTSHYKIFYHIYAGNDEGVQYKVYLKNPPATSYYASNPEVPVKSGYIAAGSSADESIDFTAPSGYKELCVVINAKRECGFKSVTTSFGLDILSKKYVQEQATNVNIKTEKECISGSPSALSMATLNLQAGAEEVLNPEIAMRGIVRVCATANPDSGVGTTDVVTCGSEVGKVCGKGFECVDGSCVGKGEFSGTVQKSVGRWKDVGYCGSANLRCWLDVDSVKDDLEVISALTGDSISILEERKGLIENTRLDLEGVAALLGKARRDIGGLTSDDAKKAGGGFPVKGRAGEILRELDKVIGNESQPGAGTNGDRAEALALKASVYRLLAGLVVREGAGDSVVGAREEGIGEDADLEEADLEEYEEMLEKDYEDEEVGSCEDCGGGVVDFNICDEDECSAIGARIGESCEFNYWTFSCVEASESEVFEEDCSSICEDLGEDYFASFGDIEDAGECEGEFSGGCCCIEEIGECEEGVVYELGFADEDDKRIPYVKYENGAWKFSFYEHGNYNAIGAGMDRMLENGVNIRDFAGEGLQGGCDLIGQIGN